MKDPDLRKMFPLHFKVIDYYQKGGNNATNRTKSSGVSSTSPRKTQRHTRRDSKQHKSV